MSLQFHPLAFGVMLVVAVGTAAYTYWKSRNQHANYTNSESRSRPMPYYADINSDEVSSTKSSILDEDERPKKKRNSDRCAICLGSLKYSLKALTCTHIFHENCITTWLVTNNTCPICRKVAN